VKDNQHIRFLQFSAKEVSLLPQFSNLAILAISQILMRLFLSAKPFILLWMGITMRLHYSQINIKLLKGYLKMVDLPVSEAQWLMIYLSK
jgi:hypothetical protein